jgi:hypothetical protein
LGYRHPSIRIRFCGRRIEGHQEQKQRSAPSSVGSKCASSLARAHTLSLGRRLDLCQSPLPWQDPYTYQILFRRRIRPVIERVSTLKSSKQEPIGWHTLRRSLATLLISNGENVQVAQSQLRHTTPKITLELYAQAFSADQQKAHRKAVQMMLPAKFPEKLKARSAAPTGVETVLGVRGCPNSTLPKSSKYFEILVSAAGLEPATHALKGHCSTN